MKPFIMAMLYGISVLSISSVYAANTEIPLDTATPADLEEETRPIEAYISPNHLFWHDNGEDLYKIYHPLKAYDKPNGKQIGEVVMSKPQCYSKFFESLSTNEDYIKLCQDYGKHSLIVSGKAYTLFTGEYGYGESGLITFSPVVLAGNHIWSKVEYPKGNFWVNTSSDDVYYYETLAHLISSFDTWCSDLGKCTPLSQEMAGEMLKLKPLGEKASSYFAGCFQDIYQITGLATFNGKNYYQVEMAELFESAPKTKLPKTGYIPTRNQDGSHTGYFFSRGC